MSFVQKHPKSGVYRIRRLIPVAARQAFQSKSVFLRSLGTKDAEHAKRLAFPILADLDKRIAEAQSQAGFWSKHGPEFYLVKFLDRSFPGDPYRFESRSEFQEKLQDFFRSELPLSKPDQFEFQAYCEAETDLLYPPENTKPAGPVINKQQGVTLSQLEQKLIQHNGYRRKTLREARKAFSYLEELYGNCLVREITADHARELREILLAYPVSGRTDGIRKLGLREAVKSKYPHTMAPKSVGKIFSFLRSGFKLSTSEGWTDLNPFRDITMPKRTSTSRITKRVDWRPKDLMILFRSPLYTGAKSRDRFSEPGPYFDNGYRKWLPLIALHTGARMTEMTQLETTDVLQDQGVWFFRITERSDADATESGEDTWEKHVKTKGSTRDVPIHKELIRLGFVRWFQGLNRKGVLWDHQYPNPDILSREYSKWFKRYNRAIGLDIPGLTFHSFRHNFASAGRLANMPEEINECLRGAKPQSVAAKYGQSRRMIETLRDYLDTISYPGLPK